MNLDLIMKSLLSWTYHKRDNKGNPWFSIKRI